MNVCEALLHILADHGVKYVFGVPGDAINEFVEAVRRQDKIRFIHVMHEEAGAFAASATAKLTGDLTVCVGTAGPGAIHLLNGLYDAKMDHAPVLAITGQVPTNLMGAEYHQEVDLQSLFADVTVFNQTIVDPAQMPVAALLACQTAISKSGVAHLSIPTNVSKMKVGAYKERNPVVCSGARILPYKDDLTEAAERIDRAEKPCILAGIGARNAVNELVDFANRIGAPIIKTLRGKDILPDLHPLVLGGIGLLGTVPAYKAIKSCDLLIAIGTDFPYHEFYPDADVPVIQVDIAAHRIGRRHNISTALNGDAKLTIAALLPMVKAKKEKHFLEDAQQHMQKWLKEQDEIEFSQDVPVHPQVLARAISEQAHENAVVCCDTGAVTVWGARDFRLKAGQRFTLSGGLASMAFGLPAALGAQLAFPERQVIALCGDGGFAMLMADFATAVKYKLPIRVFIFNNSKLGLIQMEEEAGSGNPEYQTSLHNPDYGAFAEICGGEGFTVRKPQQLQATIAKALQSPKPCIVNVYVDPGEITWPPAVEASEAINYIAARIKEFITRTKG